MAWEMALFRRTRLARYQNCLRLFDAYADCAPLWERTLLSAYVSLGPPLACLFGAKTGTAWQQAESIIEDLFAVSEMTPHDVVRALRQYVTLRQNASHHLPSDQARELIYDQRFYPLVTHFTLAFQSSAVDRLRFVRRTASAIGFSKAMVADLGCGSGAMLCEVLHLNAGWTGCGLDISSAAVDYARRLAVHKGVASRTHFQQGNIVDLPFAKGSIDLLIASEVIEHLPKPQAALAEIARVLAPGGLLALTVPVESHTPAHVNSLSNAEEFRALCWEAGLRVRSLSSEWHLTFGDDPRHLFAVAQSRTGSEVASGVYPL